MKVFKIILLQLILLTNNVHSSSYSFIDLLSSIIDNVRFVEENYINSKFPLDPSIQFGSFMNMNTSNCSRDMQLLYHDLMNKQIWALKTFDSWGKLPSGLMQGNIYWIGSVYECGHYLRGLNNTLVDQPFRTRTCTIGNGLSNHIRPVYGLCVPQSCNANDIVDFINRQAIRIPLIKDTIRLTNDSVHCIEIRSLDLTAILTIVLLCIIILLILFATGMHVIYGHKHDLTMNDSLPPSTNEPLLSRTTTNIISTTNEIDEHDQFNSSDEITPLLTRSEGKIDSVAQNLISCCSLINNYQILKFSNYPKQLACLNGIRVLSLSWIILGHTIMFAVYYSVAQIVFILFDYAIIFESNIDLDNLITIFNWNRKFWFQIILQTFFSIDSFFVLSGLLTAFTYFISKNENERFSTVKFILQHYVYSYLRYTPLYALILLIYITLSPYLGQGGPIYPIDGIETPSCRRYWWRNLLYINNFFNIRDSCMPVTWFLAINMQFHWISPLFLLITSWKWLLGMLVSLVLIIVDIVTTSVIVSKNNYDYGFLSDFYANKSNWSDMTHGYFNDVYIKPWCRLSPYAVGLAIGYILYEIYQRSNTLSWENLLPQRTIYTRSYYIKQIIIWTLALIILSLCIFGTFGDYSGHPLTRRDRIAFLTLSRLGWAIGVCIVIIACFAGHGGLANRLLSQTCFYTLSKLTYGAYLWHTLIIFINYLGREQPTHYTVANIFFNFICYTIVSYLLSFLTFLFIELPIIQLLKLIFKRPTKFN